MRQHVFAIAGFIAMLPWAAAAQPLVTSQEGIALENQILQLQNQVQQMQGSGGSGNGSSSGSALGDDSGNAPAPASGSAAPSADIVGNLLNQVSQLQAQVQQLSGRIDTLQNQVDTQNAATQKAIGDLNFKVTGSATPGTAAPGAPPLPPPSGSTPDLPAPAPTGLVATTPAAPASSAAALHTAQLALAKQDYATAETNARAVLANTKSAAEGYKAQYILAQSLAGENRPSDAAIAYDNAYNRNRTGPYAPGSLLGLANSLTDIQQASAACDTLASLNSQFPTPPAGMGPKIQAAEKRANCN
jgi:TolA-binding protein